MIKRNLIAAIALFSLASAALAADNAVVVTPGVGVTIRSQDNAGVHQMFSSPATALGVAITGPAGTPSAGAITVQGNASGTAVPVSVATIPSHAVTNAGTFATQSTLQAGTAGIGKLTANSGVDIGDVDVTSSALPTGAATAAKQPALGTAGSASSDVISIQGIASGTAVAVSGAGGAALATDRAEDSAHVSADTGPSIVVIQDATPADNATDGDYANPQMDDGGVWVQTLASAGTADGTITRIADHAAYTAGDAISDSTTVPTAGGFTLSSMCRKAGSSGIISDIYIATGDDATVPLQGRLYIYDQAVTAINDNAAFAVTDAESFTAIGEPLAFTMVDYGDQHSIHLANLARGYTCVGTVNLRFLMQAVNAYDPAANSGVFKIRVKYVQTN